MPQDDRFDWLVDHFKPKSEVPAVLSTTDIAGLVKGAAEGKGLGNAFLSHIAAVDGIFHLCRGFPGEKVRLRTGPRQLHTFGQAVPQ